MRISKIILKTVLRVILLLIFIFLILNYINIQENKKRYNYYTCNENQISLTKINNCMTTDEYKGKVNFQKKIVFELSNKEKDNTYSQKIEIKAYDENGIENNDFFIETDNEVEIVFLDKKNLFILKSKEKKYVNITIKINNKHNISKIDFNLS